MLLLAACTENGLVVDDDPKGGTDTEVEDSQPVDTDVETVPCDDVDFTSAQWWGSQPYSTDTDPTDGAGRPYYDADFDLAGWSTVSMPDEGHIPAGSDRAYRGVVSLSSLSERIFMDLQSDDGLGVYVNGSLVGHWGGGWQEEGCVNDEANCVVTTMVSPVEITDYLQLGDNVLAARVSNPVDNAYFMLHAYCAGS